MPEAPPPGCCRSSAGGSSGPPLTRTCPSLWWRTAAPAGHVARPHWGAPLHVRFLDAAAALPVGLDITGGFVCPLSVLERLVECPRAWR